MDAGIRRIKVASLEAEALSSSENIRTSTSNRSNRDDLNGRMRRRMTVLSRDPKLNDKLLRKRALQRQLKVCCFYSQSMSPKEGLEANAM